MPPHGPGEHRQSEKDSESYAMASKDARMQEMYNRYATCPPLIRTEPSSTSSCRAIAVIGSTGFLGPYIVASLLRAHPKCTVFCLNRSAEGQERTLSALGRIIDCHISTYVPRLRFFITDITQPLFGLNGMQAELLIAEIDELIFNAWDPHWGKPLAYFGPFLKGIRNTIDYCASAQNCPGITFISSICAVGDWPLLHSTMPRVPEEVIWNNRSAMPHGYGESKCVAEQLLAKAHMTSGLRISIVRAGQIGGPSRWGTEMRPTKVWPRQGWIYSIIRMSRKLGVFPTHVQPLDWIPVDSIADGIVNITKGAPTPATLKVFNMVHPNPSEWSVLYNTLRSRFGLTLEPISLPIWLQKLDPGDLKLHDFLSALGNGREQNMSFENANALTVLPQVVPISQDLLVSWLEGWDLRPRGSKSKL